jgi:hypothetical protein
MIILRNLKIKSSSVAVTFRHEHRSELMRDKSELKSQLFSAPDRKKIHSRHDLNQILLRGETNRLYRIRFLMEEQKS